MSTRVCALSDLSVSSAKKVVVDGVPIAVVMDSAGAVHALGDTCTHGDISLSEGFVEDDTLECWAHGSKFELTLAQVVERAPKLEMAYNPNDCAEIRWGAPPKSDEAKTCRRRAPGDQLGQMRKVRAWFRERKRPPRS